MFKCLNSGKCFVKYFLSALFLYRNHTNNDIMMWELHIRKKISKINAAAKIILLFWLTMKKKTFFSIFQLLLLLIGNCLHLDEVKEKKRNKIEYFNK